MKKSFKFLALSLASVSIMSLTAPAFASSAATDDGESIFSEENAEDAGYSESAVPDGYNYEDAQTSEAGNEGSDTTAVSEATASADAAEENAGETADSEELGSAKEPVCTPYINENHEKVYTGKYATAYVTHDGYSGHIKITDSSIWDASEAMTQIGGYALDDIIKFKYSGSVSGIGVKNGDGGTFYDNCIYVLGCADYSWGGQLDFVDESLDVYGLSLYSSDFKLHSLNYNSDHPEITEIYWYSQYYDGSGTMAYDVDTTKDLAIPEKGTFYEMEDGWKIYKDEYATAIVPPTPFADDTTYTTETGRIFITDDDFWKKGEALTEINGIPLSQITKLKEGYISSVNTVHDDGIFFKNTLKITGAHYDDGFFMDSTGYYEVTCIDKTKDHYGLTIASTEEKEHTVWYNSDDPEIIEIDWKIQPDYK